MLGKPEPTHIFGKIACSWRLYCTLDDRYECAKLKEPSNGQPEDTPKNIEPFSGGIHGAICECSG